MKFLMYIMPRVSCANCVFKARTLGITNVTVA
jgi:hypothetical protein